MNSPLNTLLVLLSLSIGGSAQTLGQDICACSPGTYEITFDFSLVCPPTNVTRGDGIEDIACLISPFGAPAATDLVPVSVESIDVLEVGGNLQVIFQDEIMGPFVNGDTFTYTTNFIEGAMDIPKGIQLNTHALNQAGENILNVLNIVYTNDCNIYPVIDANQSAGWFLFTDLGPPQSGVCPLSETGAPTEAPSNLPTAGPVVETEPPTAQPTPGALTDLPTGGPTSMPTGGSTAPPTETPTPTEAPSNLPTAGPVVESEPPTAQPDETDPPTGGPTSMPTGEMSMSMSMSMHFPICEFGNPDCGSSNSSSKNSSTKKSKRESKKGSSGSKGSSDSLRGSKRKGSKRS